MKFGLKMSRRGFLALAASGAAASAQDLEGTGEISAADVMPPLADMTLGAADAPVTLIEYASASCPNCAAFYAEHFGALEAAYIRKGRVRFILREYPHNDAALAAFMVARCAPEEAYFRYLHSFFTTQNAWTINPHDGLLKIALGHGMSGDVFERCLKDGALAARIHEGRNLARAHGVDGVPTFFLNGERYEGEHSYEGLSVEIDRLLR